MEVIVLAGGLGTRLQAVISDVPKPMAPVAGRPFLQILLEYLVKQGAERLLLSVGHMSSIITDFFGDSFMGVPIVYCIERRQLGTGGAIKLALEKVESKMALVVNGDTFVAIDLEELLKTKGESDSPIIVTRFVSDVSRYGAVKVEEGRISAFSEKHSSGPGLINAGIYLLPKNHFFELNLGEKFSLENDFLPSDVSKQTYLNHTTTGEFIDIGTPSDYEAAQRIWG